MIFVYINVVQYMNDHDTDNHPVLQNVSARTKDKIAISLMRIFNDGPDVSLRGSPTVSPNKIIINIYQ